MRILRPSFGLRLHQISYIIRFTRRDRPFALEIFVHSFFFGTFGSSGAISKEPVVRVSGFLLPMFIFYSPVQDSVALVYRHCRVSTIVWNNDHNPSETPIETAIWSTFAELP